MWRRSTAAHISSGFSLGGLDYIQDRISEYLRAEHDVLVARILAPMMADATDRGDKQHGGRQFAREPLSVVPSAGRHADVLAGCAGFRGAIKRRLERRVHHSRRAGAEPLDGEFAASALVGDPRQAVKLGV